MEMGCEKNTTAAQSVRCYECRGGRCSGHRGGCGRQEFSRARCVTTGMAIDTIEWANEATPRPRGRMKEQGRWGWARGDGNGDRYWQRRRHCWRHGSSGQARRRRWARRAMAPLYARPTGHTIPANFRPLWQSLGGADGLGWPLDEVQPTAHGHRAVVSVRADLWQCDRRTRACHYVGREGARSSAR